ncbi:MAG: hypothetical protein RRY16_03225 [Bacilli bacterium]
MEQSKKILPFGRFNGTKETSNFLCFTFVNGKTKTDKYKVHIKTSKKKMKSKKKDVKYKDFNRIW